MIELHLVERSLSSGVHRPRPEIHRSSNGDLLIVATPWGHRDVAKRAIDRMLEYISLAKADREATAPLPRLTCLTPLANTIRISALLTNEMIFREDNKESYRSGVEVVALALDHAEIVWMQVGNPQIFLLRPPNPPVPVAAHLDLSFDIAVRTPGTRQSAPLPNSMLGLDSTVNLGIGSFRCQPHDQLLLISHPNPPLAVLSQFTPEMTLDQLAAKVAGHAGANGPPFWLGAASLQFQAQTNEIDRVIEGLYDR
jgi:hypothetical protein